MPRVDVIWVGRAKRGFFAGAEDHYRQALGRHVDLAVTEVKDGPGKLPPAKRAEAEAEGLMRALGTTGSTGAGGAGRYCVCLDGGGRTLSSEKLADFLGRRLEDANRPPAFVVGGAYGLAPAVLARADMTLSFGPMTFPHELARVMLLEQLYRAVNILRGTPYHHG